MKKNRKLLSFVLALSILATMISSITVANAAKKNVDPWHVYYALREQFEDLSAYSLADDIWTANGHLGRAPYNENSFGKVGSAIGARLGFDSQGTTVNGVQYGSVAVVFKAPVAGTYVFDFAVEQIGDQGYSGSLNVGTVDDQDAITEIQTHIFGQNGTSYDNFTNALTLEAGERAIMKLNSGVNGLWASWWNGIEYKMTNTATNKTYSFFDGASVELPEVILEKKQWTLGENRVPKAVDTSVWSYGWTSNVGDNGVAIGGWEDTTTWTVINPETAANANGVGIFNQNGTSWVNTQDINGGWMQWKPDGDASSNGKGTLAIGWTAPAAGSYIFDLDFVNVGLGEQWTSDKTQHVFAYKKADETTATYLEIFQMPGSTGAGNEPVPGKKTVKLDVEEGETIYLLNDSNGDGWMDKAIMKYRVIDAADTTKVWNPAASSTYQLSDSPFNVYTGANGITSLSNLVPFTKLIYDATQTRCQYTTSDPWSRMTITDNGFHATINDEGTGCPVGRYITFEAPVDGCYKADFAVKNANGEAYAPNPASISLYHAKERTGTVGTALATVTGEDGKIPRDRYVTISKIVKMTAGEKLLFAVNPSDGWVFAPTGTVTVKYLEEYNFTTQQNGSVITEASELVSGATLLTTLDYLAEETRTIQIVTAVFDRYNTMHEVDISDALSAAAGEVTTFETELVVPDVDGAVVKTFVIDGINTLKPYRLPYEVK